MLKSTRETLFTTTMKHIAKRNFMKTFSRRISREFSHLFKSNNCKHVMSTIERQFDFLIHIFIITHSRQHLNSLNCIFAQLNFFCILCRHIPSLILFSWLFFFINFFSFSSQKSSTQKSHPKKTGLSCLIN